MTPSRLSCPSFRFFSVKGDLPLIFHFLQLLSFLVSRLAQEIVITLVLSAGLFISLMSSTVSLVQLYLDTPKRSSSSSKEDDFSPLSSLLLWSFPSPNNCQAKPSYRGEVYTQFMRCQLIVDFTSFIASVIVGSVAFSFQI